MNAFDFIPFTARIFSGFNFIQKSGAKIVSKTADETKEEHLVLCSSCGFRLTENSRQIRINDSCTHSFTNPSGLIFNITCFSKASGCIITGEKTYEYSWFPGFGWKFAHCGECLMHNGWFYSNNDESECFFGLIIEKINFS